MGIYAKDAEVLMHKPHARRSLSIMNAGKPTTLTRNSTEVCVCVCVKGYEQYTFPFLTSFSIVISKAILHRVIVIDIGFITL